MEKQKRSTSKTGAASGATATVVQIRRVSKAAKPRAAESKASRTPFVSDQPKRRGEIVSSSHLANSAVPELSEFEFGLIVVDNAFSRWIVRCMSAAGLPGLTSTDVLVLHHVHHRARDKRLADIAFTLNVEDQHVVNYSLKKLLAAKVVETERVGKEVLYRTNDQGKAYIDRYREIRERCLVAALSTKHGDADTVQETARVLRWLSGLYDQAARAATSL
jgi:predicted MarR family transcription regulator